MQCLYCENIMLTVTERELFGSLTYDVCNRCGGLWLDKGELDKIADQTPGSVEESSVDYLNRKRSKEMLPPKGAYISVRTCRRCPKKSLTKLPFMGNKRIVLDYCETCGGLWVDGGELSEINRYIEWFDKKAKPSNFDRFLRHVNETFWHRIHVTLNAD